MPNLNRSSKTYRNLKDAFGIESEASCRYLYFARQADIEGFPDVGGLFRDRGAVAGETYAYTKMYPGMARIARDEGFTDVAEWFETLAKAEKSHEGRFQKALDSLSEL